MKPRNYSKDGSHFSMFGNPFVKKWKSLNFRKPEFTFVIQRISSNDSSGQETIAESSCGGSTMATTTDRLLYKPDEIMHALAAYVMRVR